MRATYETHRGDLVRLSLYLLPRQKANWVLVVLAAVAFIGWQVWIRQPESAGRVLLLVVAGIFVVLCGLAGAFVASLVPTLLRADARSGALGPHVVTLAEDGLTSESNAGVGVLKWAAIRSISKDKRYIFFKLTSQMFLLVPRRAFGVSEHFEAFWQRARQLHERALAQPTVQADGPASGGSAA